MLISLAKEAEQKARPEKCETVFGKDARQSKRLPRIIARLKITQEGFP
ncbi:hypothetical protein CEV31_3404 [Brucella thiophenivorans]|uniref:Uncharacterized protein n=1 Tax=Brucella thiophenivorans TaxID=571255 RepID=A0A256FEZ1_9HYPH|nr:hypothetical protein CEV31_3404 [Brucella thiophenivorans]